ncbi:MAG: response regulator [bacterium]|nr:response regulator [bacterium]
MIFLGYLLTNHLISEAIRNFLCSEFLPDTSDGIIVLQKIRKLSAAPPIIMMSGFIDEDIEKKALENGAAGFIAKPFEDDIARTISSYLKSR